MQMKIYVGTAALGCPAGQSPEAPFACSIPKLSLLHPSPSPCHAERSRDESKAIVTAESKHPYPHPQRVTKECL